MKAVLDANVLFPTVLREILTEAAASSLFTPLWSERIISEWVHSTIKLGPEQRERAGAEAALLRLRFPQAGTAVWDETGLGVQLPDAGDLHVLACAMSGGADLIVTMNLRDFPRHALARLGLRAVHPDVFLCDLARDHPSKVAGSVQMALDRAIAAGGDLSQAGLLKRAGLPRLNKALSRAINTAAAPSWQSLRDTGAGSEG